jgi:hypothetical protein
MSMLEQTTVVLARTPAALNALLRDLPDEWTMRNEGGDTWCAFDVVAHLIDCERVDWMPRALMIREKGESQTFVPFDRDGHRKEALGHTLPELLDEFARLRSENLVTLGGWQLGEEDLALRGRHPAFGPVTLSQLLSTWAAHDLNHLHHISRILAHQYREAVGPWSAYLGVMQCQGHSAP